MNVDKVSIFHRLNLDISSIWYLQISKVIHQGYVIYYLSMLKYFFKAQKDHYSIDLPFWTFYHGNISKFKGSNN